jgi:hypothetical protein
MWASYVTPDLSSDWLEKLQQAGLRPAVARGDRSCAYYYFTVLKVELTWRGKQKRNQLNILIESLCIRMTV